MKINRFFRISLISLVLVMSGNGWAAESLDFKEVYELLRTNLAGATEAELNQAAAEGLISQLQPKVWLVTNDSQTVSNTSSILRTAVYDNGYGYFRLGKIREGTDQQLRSAYQNLSSSNRLKGLILDLRFAHGRDYKAATALADIFFSTEQPLMDYGEGLKNSTIKTTALSLPVALLVNRKTAGAAEALVGILRQADIGIAIGSPTAGKAALSKEFTLKTGQRLQVAAAPIKVGKDKALPLTGLSPEILLEVSLQDELAYVEDAYKELSKPARLAKSGTTNLLDAATNRLSHRPRSEAELVRMLKDGEMPDMESNTKGWGRDILGPMIQDPALLRALDLLKGLAVLQQARRL